MTSRYSSLRLTLSTAWWIIQGRVSNRDYLLVIVQRPLPLGSIAGALYVINEMTDLISILLDFIMLFNAS